MVDGVKRVCVEVGLQGPMPLLDPCFNPPQRHVPKKAEEEAAASSRRRALVSRRAMVVAGGGLADGCRVCVAVCGRGGLDGVGGGLPKHKHVQAAVVQSKQNNKPPIKNAARRRYQRAVRTTHALAKRGSIECGGGFQSQGLQNTTPHPKSTKTKQKHAPSKSKQTNAQATRRPGGPCAGACGCARAFSRTTSLSKRAEGDVGSSDGGGARLLVGGAKLEKGGLSD